MPFNAKSLANLRPRWQPGQAGNPHGKQGTAALFLRELRKVEAEKGITLFEHAIRKAFTDKVILDVILKKILPDLHEVFTIEEIKHDYGDKLNELITAVLGRIKPAGGLPGSGDIPGGSPTDSAGDQPK